jgi:hypothetical protein
MITNGKLKTRAQRRRHSVSLSALLMVRHPSGRDIYPRGLGFAPRPVLKRLYPWVYRNERSQR